MNAHGYANRLGYGFCQPCADERDEPLNPYTPEHDETCERCGESIADQFRAPPADDWQVETTPCRIF